MMQIILYLEIIENDKGDFDANHLHGTVLSQREKFSEAITFFSIAYESSSPTPELLNNYAIALRNVRAYSECEKMLIEALELDPKFPNSYLNLSNCYKSQKKLYEALFILEASVDNLNIPRCRKEIVSTLFAIYKE